jgi:hypothetical protein
MHLAIRAAAIVLLLVIVFAPAVLAHYADRPFVLDCGGLSSERCEQLWRGVARSMRWYSNGIGPATYAKFIVSSDGTCVTELTMERGTFTFGLLATYHASGVCN